MEHSEERAQDDESPWWELLVCNDCDQEYVRSAGRKLAMPCRNCGSKKWCVYGVVRGTLRRVIEY